jgi:hypothetical protein
MILPTRALLALLGRRSRSGYDPMKELQGDEWAKYRKRPLVVDAKMLNQRVEIETREGTMVGEPMDYLVIGVEGEVYPVGREIFEKTYDEV